MHCTPVLGACHQGLVCFPLSPAVDQGNLSWGAHGEHPPAPWGCPSAGSLLGQRSGTSVR